MPYKTINTFAEVYDNFSPMLYGIALQISPSQQVAEQILIKTFVKLSGESILQQEHASLCLSLIKLLIQTAHEKLNNNSGKTNFKLKIFEDLPILHYFICEQFTLEDYCIENKTTKLNAMKLFREELQILSKRKLEHKNFSSELNPTTNNFVK